METNTIFKGYAATLENSEGAKSPCWVANFRESVKFNDGTEGPAYKVQVGCKVHTGGWSGGGGKWVTNYSKNLIWVKASRVS